MFVANDQMALGVLNALRAEGLSVPGDISVVGFDDVPECAYYVPPLTTVRQDFAELGRRGVQLVLARLRGEELEADPVLPELVVRASSGPVRATRRPVRIAHPAV
ncbi:substrate-binding domain-containing protein [Modestobacter lacusdianchii]